MKIGVVGGVSSTSVLLSKLAEHHFENVEVWCFVPNDASSVSGWVDLRKVCEDLKFSHSSFSRVQDVAPAISDYKPDILFAVGLSQLIPADVIAAASTLCIGFHPTKLPKGRGRAPIAWLILEQAPGAATFFRLGSGIDDGEILVQVPFEVTHEDDAQSIERKMLDAEARALDRLLPELKNGAWTAVEQDHANASWFGKRTPEDGWVDWRQDSSTLHRLIRASAPPHPGAYTFAGTDKVRLLRSELTNVPSKGAVGRITHVDDDDSFIVQTGSRPIRILRWDAQTNWRPRVGRQLGYFVENEIQKLILQVAELQQRIRELESSIKQPADANGN